MAWQDELIPMLRVLIDDLETTPDNSNSKLEQILLIGARYVEQDADFDFSYTITFSTRTISPDPTTKGDSVFENLMLLKAACILDQAELKKQARQHGLKIRCGPAQLDTLQRINGFAEVLNSDFTPCKLYEVALKNHQFGNAKLVKAILSPFTSSNFDPASLRGFHPLNRDRFN